MGYRIPVRNGPNPSTRGAREALRRRFHVAKAPNGMVAECGASGRVLALEAAARMPVAARP